jgi:hypothetical protein
MGLLIEDVHTTIRNVNARQLAQFTPTEENRKVDSTTLKLRDRCRATLRF